MYVYLQTGSLSRICMFIFKQVHFPEYVCMSSNRFTFQNMYVCLQTGLLSRICVFIFKQMYVYLQTGLLSRICMYVFKQVYFSEYVRLSSSRFTFQNRPMYVYLQKGFLSRICMFIFKQVLSATEKLYLVCVGMNTYDILY